MKNSKTIKSGLLAGGLAVLLAGLPLLGGQNVLASEPTIKEVRGRQTYELKLPIKYEKYAKKDVRIKLYATNTFTGEETVTTHNRKLDSDGRVTLRVDGLAPGTVYRFKVRIKKQSGGDYSDKSDGRMGSTKYISQK